MLVRPNCGSPDLDSPSFSFRGPPGSPGVVVYRFLCTEYKVILRLMMQRR